MTASRLDQAEFAENPEPRCPVVLLLDTSGSMGGEPIAQLNQGLQQFAQEIGADPLASLRVEVALVTFGGAVRAIDLRGGGEPIPFAADQAFVTVDSFQPPRLTTGGDTPMGEGVRRALTLLRERKEIYRQAGLDYFRPWIFLMTDGQPTDRGWETAADLARQEEDRKGVVVFPVGVEGANLPTLAR
ncbi:MAG: vWA domain-containing protein, partial [Candidatus Limnocylindria bacterium]